METTRVATQITARGVALGGWWRDKILKKARKLEEFYGRITACRVIVEAPPRRRHKGGLHNVLIRLELPRKVIVVNREPERSLGAAIEKAFDAAVRRLEDHARLLKNPHGGPRILVS